MLRPRSGRGLPGTGRGRPRGSSGAAPTGSFHSQRGRLRTGPVPGTSPRGLGRYTPSFLPGIAPTRRKIHKHGHMIARSGTTDLPCPWLYRRGRHCPAKRRGTQEQDKGNGLSRRTHRPTTKVREPGSMDAPHRKRENPLRGPPLLPSHEAGGSAQSRAQSSVVLVHRWVGQVSDENRDELTSTCGDLLT